MRTEPIEPYIDYLLSQNSIDIDRTCKFISKFIQKAASADGIEFPIEGIDKQNLCTICNEDSLMLYLLVSEIKPARIFEIGTWYGTSAFSMATALDDLGVDGEIITCDFKRKYYAHNPYWKTINYFNLYSYQLTKHLTEREWIPDFIFLDCLLVENDALYINHLIKRGVIVATHDWYLPEIRQEKGFPAFKAIDEAEENNFVALVPSNPIVKGSHRGINGSIACLTQGGK